MWCDVIVVDWCDVIVVDWWDVIAVDLCDDIVMDRCDVIVVDWWEIKVKWLQWSLHALRKVFLLFSRISYISRDSKMDFKDPHNFQTFQGLYKLCQRKGNQNFKREKKNKNTLGEKSVKTRSSVSVFSTSALTDCRAQIFTKISRFNYKWS